MTHNKKSDQTRIVQTGIGKDPATGAVAPPLHTSSTYIWKDIDTKGTFDYGRTKNPTRELLTEALVALENGAGGEIVNSGMAAIDLCLNLLNADDLILAPHDCYGGTHRLFTHRALQNRSKPLWLWGPKWSLSKRRPIRSCGLSISR